MFVIQKISSFFFLKQNAFNSSTMCTQGESFTDFTIFTPANHSVHFVLKKKLIMVSHFLFLCVFLLEYNQKFLALEK